MILAWLRRKPAEPGLASGDAAYMNDLQASLLTQTTPGSRLMLYLILGLLVSALVWADQARVEEITRGEGIVISLSREQVIQSLDGGIPEQMSVQEGSVVDKGEVLLRFEPTRAESSYREALSKVSGLQASISRLRAEAYATELVFDAAVAADTALVGQETQAFNARKQALDQSVAALERSYELSNREIRMAEPLVAKGLMSAVEMLRMQRQANDLLSQIVERTNKYRADANSELSRMELELGQARENLAGRADVFERTTLRAPVRGTVKNVRFNTVGGVIQPGESILEIVPLEDQLLVEGKIRPADVAFLHPGLPATVKISAYDYAIYGSLQGHVEHISPGTLKDEQTAAAGRQDDTYYRVLVRTDSSTLDAGDQRLPILPGMIASVDIRTGEKTILDYLLKPVLKAREAFRER